MDVIDLLIRVVNDLLHNTIVLLSIDSGGTFI